MWRRRARRALDLCSGVWVSFCKTTNLKPIAGHSLSEVPCRRTNGSGRAFSSGPIRHTVYTTVYTARPGPPATRVPRTHTSTLNSDDHKLNLCRGGPSARQVSVLDCLRWRQRSTYEPVYNVTLADFQNAGCSLPTQPPSAHSTATYSSCDLALADRPALPLRPAPRPRRLCCRRPPLSCAVALALQAG